jgi:hypothetical protein
MSTSLYRIYNGDQVLLYVGISGSAIKRLSEHRLNQPWANEIATVTLEHFYWRDDAERAEQIAILNEWPIYNVSHNPRKMSVRDRKDWDRDDFSRFYWSRAGKPNGIIPQSLELLACEPNMSEHNVWKLRACAALICLGAPTLETFHDMFMKSPVEIDDLDHARRIRQLVKANS